jgi:hypothetical protein
MRQPGHREQYATLGLALGVSYDSAAVVPDGTPAPQIANPVTDYIPSARPAAARRTPGCSATASASPPTTYSIPTSRCWQAPPASDGGTQRNGGA